MTHISEQMAVDPASSAADTLEWLHKNTNFPTFEQFKKDPDKWRAHKNEIFDCIENMNVGFRDRVHSMKFLWRGKYKCKTLGKVHEAARNEGHEGTDLEFEPIVEPVDGTSNLYNSRVKITVNVWPKKEFRMRGGVVAND